MAIKRYMVLTILSRMCGIFTFMSCTAAFAANEPLEVVLDYNGSEFSRGPNWSLYATPYSENGSVKKVAEGEINRDKRAHERITLQVYCSSYEDLKVTIRPFQRQTAPVSTSYKVSAGDTNISDSAELLKTGVLIIEDLSLIHI